MNLNVTFPELLALQRRVGAPDTDWTLDADGLDPRTKLILDLEEGIEIDLKDVEREPGGLLSYKGEHVILYIKDTGDDYWTLKNEPWESRKFHLYDCQTLKKMEEMGRFRRYVVSRRTDGMFKVFWRNDETGDHGEMEAKLNVCQNCLKNINWMGYRERKSARGRIVKMFEISEFLLEHATFFRKKPDTTENTAVPNEYVQNWRSISVRRKEYVGWCCQQCGVKLEEKRLRRYLHCHHINGDRTDNRQQNLKVLCALCHREQFAHGRMRVSEEARQNILQARKEQDLP